MSIFHGRLSKKGGKLKYSNSGYQKLYDTFTAAIKEGQTVEIYMEASDRDGTLPQLAKVHVCIREIAKETGYTVAEVKLIIKEKSGLVVKRKIEGKEYLDWKSFGDCSKEDLGLAIQTCIELGQDLNLNLG